MDKIDFILYSFLYRFEGSCFLKRGKIKLPGQLLFTSEPPDYYEPHHMFIGATLNINGFIFVLTDADEYALRYMELHPNEVKFICIELFIIPFTFI